MHRRRVLQGVVGVIVVGAGCLEPSVETRETGEIDVTFQTEAEQSSLLRGRLLDGDSEPVDTLESEFPPDEPGGPSFYAGGLGNGPYVFIVETEADSVRVEWTIEDCKRLDVTITVLADGQLEVEQTCQST